MDNNNYVTILIMTLFIIPKTTKWKQIGNQIPPKTGYEIVYVNKNEYKKEPGRIQKIPQNANHLGGLYFIVCPFIFTEFFIVNLYYFLKFKEVL